MTTFSARALRFVKKRWLLIWLILVCLALIAVFTYAAYKETNNKIMRVIAPAAKSDTLFTSNYLALGTDNFKPAYFQNAEATSYSYSVFIRNYNPADPGQIYDGTINYALNVTLVHRNGVAYDPNDPADAEALAGMGGLAVSLGTSELFTFDADNLSHSFTGRSLSGTGAGGTDEWTVAYTNIALGSDYCVKFEAVTTNPDLENISATVFTATYPVVRSQGWKCILQEAEGDSSSAHIDEYDGFNYSISGTGAKTLSFRYDSSKISINPACWLLDNTVAAPVDISGRNGWKEIVISADPDTTHISRYDFQAYKVDSYQPVSYNEIKPDTDNSYVEFEEQ